MLPEQILSDGGHIERLPMYHSRALDVLLPLDATADRALQALVRLHLPRLADSLAAMTHPDGGTALLNDSAFGVYPPPPGARGGARRRIVLLPGVRHRAAQSLSCAVEHRRAPRRDRRHRGAVTPDEMDIVITSATRTTRRSGYDDEHDKGAS